MLDSQAIQLVYQALWLVLVLSILVALAGARLASFMCCE